MKGGLKLYGISYPDKPLAGMYLSLPVTSDYGVIHEYKTKKDSPNS